MNEPPSVLQTSWVRVEGPRDARSCAWCQRWVGRVMPVELQDTYAASHSGTQRCRCVLRPAELLPDAEDPGCLWA